jgi:pentatricopeptide repeat protein
MATTQVFFDQRIAQPGTESLFHRLERLGKRAVELWDKPDAGLWELRNTQAVHTYSSVLCWAGCDRLARIARQLRMPERAAWWTEQAERIRAGTIEAAWNERIGSFTQSFGGSDPDASLLLMPSLGFLPADDPRFAGTLAFVERELRRGDHLFRYSKDEFGVPDTSFNICTFWYIDALAQVGRREEARELFEEMVASRNSAGLLSEDLDPQTKELWGNFPQTYSLVGLINSAMRLSRPWESAL